VCGCTEGILIGEYFKAVLTGVNLPADLDADMQSSRFYREYAPDQPGAVARPDQLLNTDMTGAFGNIQAPPPVTSTGPTGTPTATPAAGPSLTIQLDDNRTDPGQQISITVIGTDPAGLSWIEWEGVPKGRENSNDNSGYVDDPALARQRFDCNSQTPCANVWTAQPTISGDYILRARGRNTAGVRSDWVTTDLRIRVPSGTATPTSTVPEVATATPTATATATPPPTGPEATPTPTTGVESIDDTTPTPTPTPGSTGRTNDGA
jgi:hypothetical protein